MHLWLATDLSPADGERLGPDEDERLELHRMTLDDAIAAIERGDVADAKSIVGLLWLAQAARGRSGLSPLARPGARAAGRTSQNSVRYSSTSHWPTRCGSGPTRGASRR